MNRRQIIPSNAEGVAVTPVFGTDPYGTAMFAGALGANGLGLNSQIRPVIDARGSGRWHGATNGLQNFRGAGNLGRGRPVVPPVTRFDQTAGDSASTPMQQIFEERMAARRFS